MDRTGARLGAADCIRAAKSRYLSDADTISLCRN
jgi:hypothetical protein